MDRLGPMTTASPSVSLGWCLHLPLSWEAGPSMTKVSTSCSTESRRVSPRQASSPSTDSLCPVVSSTVRTHWTSSSTMVADPPVSGSRWPGQLPSQRQPSPKPPRSRCSVWGCWGWVWLGRGQGDVSVERLLAPLEGRYPQPAALTRPDSLHDGRPYAGRAQGVCLVPALSRPCRRSGKDCGLRVSAVLSASAFSGKPFSVPLL